jgi:ABC-type glycerol-3-phosphate transport system permease component
LVLVAINQPFTIWMLRSFFVNIPQELDEAALVDGCSRFQAFRKVIIPVMWPGVVTTGLFSFLLAYNDFLLSTSLVNAEKQTMPAAISNSIHAESELLLMQGIAGAVSITIPLIILVVIFQRQIVSGLTQGAVKG